MRVKKILQIGEYNWIIIKLSLVLKNLKLLAKDDMDNGLSNKIIYYYIRNIYLLYGYNCTYFLKRLQPKEGFYIEAIELSYYNAIIMNKRDRNLEKNCDNLIQSTNRYIYNVHFNLKNTMQKDHRYYIYLQEKYYTKEKL